MERVGHNYVQEIKKWKIHLFIRNSHDDSMCTMMDVIDAQGDHVKQHGDEDVAYIYVLDAWMG